MKTYERFLAERVQDPEPAPFDTNRKSPPVSSRTGLGMNPKAAKQLDTQRKNTRDQNSKRSFLGSIRSNHKPSFNTQSKAPSFNAKPNVNYSGRTGNAKGNQTSSGLI